MRAFDARWRAVVAERADAPALQFGGRTWSYAELDADVDAWCRHLIGLAPGQALGWLGWNSPAMLAALLACARSGLRFVPMNTRLASPEHEAIARQVGLAACHADEGFTLPAARGDARGQADDLLIAYTSGSTGEPKGSIHTQAAMLANADAAIEAQHLDATTRALAVLPLFHVGGLCIQVLPTLLAGGEVRLQPLFDPAAWLGDVAAWRPSTSLLVPATMRALVEHAAWPGADLSSLAFVNSGSQIVPRALIDAFHARGVPVCQVYGASETGPVTLVLRAHEALAHAGRAGRPALGVQVRLVDGEIQVRAPNLARGYVGRPGDPAFEGGWFRSGDLAQLDEHGYYEIVGRRKEMIISGGENIYPAEVENLLLDLPGLVECALVGLPDVQWGEVPVLAVVGDAAESEVRTRLEGRIARYKLPRRIVRVDSLPKTALGKVQRAVLAQRLAQEGPAAA